jgi:hypothetical protein
MKSIKEKVEQEESTTPSPMPKQKTDKTLIEGIAGSPLIVESENCIDASGNKDEDEASKLSYHYETSSSSSSSSHVSFDGGFA